MTTLRQAITAHCKECIYDETAIGAGTWRKQATDCTSPDCNLFPYRPVDSTENARRKAAKLKEMSPEQLMEHKRKSDNFKRVLNAKT